MQTSGQSQNNTVAPPKFLLFLLLLAIWFLGHPYRGMWHDAVFYAVQAVSLLHPEAYRNDLYFLYGSQDDFTLFSPIYAAFIDLLGLNAATITLLLAGYALWIGAATLLAGKLLRGFPFWLGLVLIIAMPGDYGAAKLGYAEYFLTPRLIAEGLTLLSLAMILSGKRLMSLAALLAAFVMHPLVALAGAAFISLYLGYDKPKAALGIGVLAATVVLLLAWSGVSPFGHLFSVMDAEWFQLVNARSPYVLWDEWRYEDWGNRTLLAFSLLAAASGTANGSVRRVFLPPLAIGVAALLLFWLGTSLFHNVLLIQLQPWRWLWLTQLFSYLAAAWLVADFWNHDRVYRLLLLGFVTAWLTLASIGGVLSVLVSGLFVWYARSGRAIVIPQNLAALLYLIPLQAAAWWLASAWLDATAEAMIKVGPVHSIEFWLVWVLLFLPISGGVISVIIFLTVWRYGADRRKFVHLATVGGIAFLLMLSFAFWDQRPPRARYYVQQALRDPLPSFSRVIPVGAVVYWEDDLQMVWFGLGRASYASIGQTVGLIFNRQTAIEGKRRVDRLAALGVEDGIFAQPGDRGMLRKGGFAGLVHVCHDPVLDFVVLSKDFRVGMIERHFDKMKKRYFYLYDCAYLRRNFADTWAGNKNERPATAGFSLPIKP
ncbi:MAG: hypothetical protein K8H75_12340 [Sulfuricella sp.]|nr:hypothetical protein [Sulfuricella sp.]